MNVSLTFLFPPYTNHHSMSRASASNGDGHHYENQSNSTLSRHYEFSLPTLSKYINSYMKTSNEGSKWLESIVERYVPFHHESDEETKQFLANSKLIAGGYKDTLASIMKKTTNMS